MPDTPYAERVLGFFTLDAGSISAESRARIEVFPGVGKYVHPVSGPFEITQADLDAWVADINERGDKIPVDFDHSFAYGKGSVAAGWFVVGSAAIEDGKVMADVDFTVEAADAIREKKFRFISPEFAFKFKDAAGKIVKQPRLWAAALTNRPFFDTMQPVTVCDQGLGDILNPTARLLDASDVELISRVADEGTKALLMSALQSFDMATVSKAREFLASLPEPTKEEPKMDDELKQLLGLGDDATPDQIRAAVKGLREDQERIAAEAAEREEIDKKLHSRKHKTTKEKEMDITLIAEELGLAADADDATVIAALREARVAIDRGNLDYDELEKLRVKASEKDKLESRIQVIEAERRSDKIKRMLDDGVRTGRVIPAEKAVLSKQFQSNPEGLHELLASRPEHIFRLAPLGTDKSTGEIDPSLFGVADEFKSQDADVDPESAKKHLMALQILAEQGIKDPNEDQYFAAMAVVEDRPLV